jgi:hypothetical protein
MNSKGVSFSFSLRKDIRDNAQASLMNTLILNAYISKQHLETAKTFINSSIGNLSNLSAVVETKPDITHINNIVQAKVQETVQSTVQATVQETVQATISTVIDTRIQVSLDSQIQQAISIITIEKQNALNEIKSHNGAGLTDSAIQLAITQLNDKNQEVLNEINLLAVSVSIQIAKMNANTRDELLQKIDFLFEMFYHGNSETIMELYPL